MDFAYEKMAVFLVFACYGLYQVVLCVIDTVKKHD